MYRRRVFAWFLFDVIIRMMCQVTTTRGTMYGSTKYIWYIFTSVFTIATLPISRVADIILQWKHEADAPSSDANLTMSISIVRHCDAISHATHRKVENCLISRKRTIFYVYQQLYRALSIKTICEELLYSHTLQWRHMSVMTPQLHYLFNILSRLTTMQR